MKPLKMKCHALDRLGRLTHYGNIDVLPVTRVETVLTICIPQKHLSSPVCTRHATKHFELLVAF